MVLLEYKKSSQEIKIYLKTLNSNCGNRCLIYNVFNKHYFGILDTYLLNVYFLITCSLLCRYCMKCNCPDCTARKLNRNNILKSHFSVLLRHQTERSGQGIIVAENRAHGAWDIISCNARYVPEGVLPVSQS